MRQEWADGDDPAVAARLRPAAGALLAIGRRAADAEGLDAVELLEGDAESLEFGEDRFDVVASWFGAIFASRAAVGPRGLSIPFEYLLVVGTKTG